MKKLLLAAFMAFCLPSLSYAQQANANPNLLMRFPPGYISPNGNQLNRMVAAINGGITCANYASGGAALAANNDSAFFIATRAMRVISVSEVHAVAAGGASVVQVVKDTGTAAPGTGTDLLTNNTNGGFNLNATANTVQVGTLVTTTGATNLAAGDRLSVDYAQAVQSTVGVVITACMAPLLGSN